MPPIFDLSKIVLSLSFLALLGLVPSAAKADTILAGCIGNTCTVNTTNGQGNIVNATATFTFAAGTINLTLTNNLTNAQMQAVNQAITGIVFTVGSGQTIGTLTSSFGQFTNIANTGIGTPAGSGPTGWIRQNNPLTICVVCSPSNPTAPEQAIIGGDGAGPYTNANGSIAGNNPHNPFLYGPVTFSLSVPGVTSETTVSTVFIRFNTEIQPATASVPEPASMLLLGSGLMGAAAAVRRRRRD